MIADGYNAAAIYWASKTTSDSDSVVVVVGDYYANFGSFLAYNLIVVVDQKFDLLGLEIVVVVDDWVVLTGKE